jgi:hypothetical protein
MSLVGAPGFEPGASCAQGRKNASIKSRRLNLSPIRPLFTNQFEMYVDVSGCSGLFARSLQNPLHDSCEVAGA